MKNRTDAYVFTADPNSVEDMQRIELLRRGISIANKGIAQKRRVSLRARLGKNNPLREKYRYITRSGAPGRLDTQYVKLADAARIDVYIHSVY